MIRASPRAKSFFLHSMTQQCQIDASPIDRLNQIAKLKESSHQISSANFLSNYLFILDRLKEDFEDLRFEALLALEFIYQANVDWFSKESFSVESGSTLTLNDALFLQACSMITDVVPSIRQHACHLLGQIKNVKLEYLLQAFSREPKSITLESTQLDSGSNFQLDNVISGALISALEDEYESVRIEAIRAIHQISLDNLEFAKQAFDVLTDMFNDEIEQVRIEAIQAIFLIGLQYRSVRIDDDGTKSLKSVLNDVSPSVRRRLFELIGICQFVNGTNLLQVISVLLAILRNSFHEKHLIMQCLLNLGRMNSLLGKCVVKEIHFEDSRYLAPQPNFKDSEFCAKMIFLLGVYENDRAGLQSKCTHSKRIDFYLRSVYPSLFPNDSLMGIQNNFVDNLYKQITLNIRNLESLAMIYKDIEQMNCRNEFGFQSGLQFLHQLVELLTDSSEERRLKCSRIYVNFLFDENVLEIVNRLSGNKNCSGIDLDSLVFIQVIYSF